jgi:hypothetical protein
MPLHHDHHATIFVPAEVAAPLEVCRRAWDPLMAEQIAAHVTLIYPREISGSGSLIKRLQNICPVTAPFRLRLGRLACFGRPEGGVYVEVADTEGACRQLRAQVLHSPAEFPLHVTLVHPRTSSRGREFWERAQPRLPESEFLVKEVAVTAFDGAKWETLHRFALKEN